MKTYTSFKQSKKLAEILSLQSADMHYERVYFEGKQSDWFVRLGKPIKSDDIIPCWSLAALLGVLPSSIKDSIGMVYSLNMNKEYIEYSNPNISSLYSAYIHTCGNDNLVDACYEMIIKLHEQNLL